ncbi:lipopolysaccharide biosynthesis protein [Roseibium aggregatum]|uniref:Polysaccharide biosynthesis protein n=1 Tax=Roseibium aggregatum (strain ATCC 25650 / DSM 13394 / JCM 20685 / NBRC 16684 / NCIMB 2208 / IAM 12614 / B1) TaxID=384765 RepID=A0NRM6_ROSAI|nr:oligosaccharide flippase family protein [Roseibium aggregatum]EAV44807.1 polysaccharide biosynthesis protein [Roseibium aggregatum IAM 12614]
MSKNSRPALDKLKALYDRLLGLSRLPLVANTISYTINFGLQLVIQLAFFLFISRALGPEGYGLFVTITSVSIMAGFVVGLGSEYLLLQRVAVEPQSFGKYLGHSLIMMGLTFPLVLPVTLALLYSLIGDSVPLSTIAIISLTDLLFTKLVILGAQSYMAFDQARKQIVINILAAALKLAFLLVATMLPGTLTLDEWAWWFFVAGLLSAVVACWLILRDLGRPVFTLIRNDLKLSMLYCIEFFSIGGMRDLDKPVVVHNLGADAGGQYAAGFRIIDAASAPVRAFLYATYTRHFRQAQGGQASSLAFGVKLLPVTVFLALPVAAFLLLTAGFIPLVLGEDFAETPIVVVCLAFYPLLMGLSGVGADVLRATGRQRVRMALLIGTSLLLIPVVTLGTMVGGLAGAALFRFAVQIALTIGTWFFILWAKAPAAADKAGR